MNKKAAVESAPDYLRILCRFLSQIYILRDSYDWHNRRVRSSAQARLIICKEQTSHFHDFCSSVYQRPQDPRFIAHLKQEERNAVWHISKLEKQSIQLEATFAALSTRFTTSERLEPISRVSFSETTVKKIMDIVNIATVQLLDDAEVSMERRPRNMIEARNAYLLRYALCMVLLYTRWMMGGGKPTGRRAGRITKDVVDMQIVATSLFFGGLLSNDQKPLDVSREAKRILRTIGAYVS